MMTNLKDSIKTNALVIKKRNLINRLEEEASVLRDMAYSLFDDSEIDELEMEIDCCEDRIHELQHEISQMT